MSNPDKHQWRASQLLRLRAGYPDDEEETWRSAAACRFTEPDLFFPISASGRALGQVAQAKAVCAGCPVRRECLAFALRTRERHGIWGGLTEYELHQLWSQNELPHLHGDHQAASGDLAG